MKVKEEPQSGRNSIHTILFGFANLDPEDVPEVQASLAVALEEVDVSKCVKQSVVKEQYFNKPVWTMEFSIPSKTVYDYFIDVFRETDSLTSDLLQVKEVYYIPSLARAERYVNFKQLERANQLMEIEPTDESKLIRVEIKEGAKAYKGRNHVFCWDIVLNIFLR